MDIELILKGGLSFGYGQIAIKFKLSSSNANKIEKNQNKLTLDQLFKILIGTGHTKKLTDVLSEYSDELREKYMNCTVENDLQLMSKKAISYFNQEDYFLMMLLAYSPEGTTRQEIKENLGNIGLKRLDKLMAENILVEEDGKIKGEEGIKLTTDQETLKNIFIFSIKNCYDSTKFGSQKNTLRYHKLSTCQEKAMPFIYEKFKTCTVEILNELEKSEYQGTDHIFFGMAFDQVAQLPLNKEGLH